MEVGGADAEVEGGGAEGRKKEGRSVKGVEEV